MKKDELELLVEDFSGALRKSGIRVTHQRLEVFRELVESRDHPDVEAVYERVRKRVPTISLDTVYRTLWMLNDMDFVSTVGPLTGRMRFDGNPRPHHHFICTQCGEVGDVYYEDSEQPGVPEQVAEMGEVENIDIHFRGVCNECLEKADAG